MKIDFEASRGWRLHTAPFQFQQTYKTPLPNLAAFVETLLAPFQVSEAAVWIELIVFEPRELIWYLRAFDIVATEGQLNGSVIRAENASQATALLECVLGQWTDFAFLPSPNNFAIYADHDEFTTIFAGDNEVLESLRTTMKQQGFEEVEDWVWTGPRSPGTVTEGETNV